jgi:hypothetical protein
MRKSEKIRMIKECKTPKTKQHHVGVEIEFLSSISTDDLNSLLADSNLHRYVNLGFDSSVEDDNGSCGCCECIGDCYEDEACDLSCTRTEGYELRVLAPEYKIHDVIRKVCKVLKQAGAYVNRSCGLHVHLDMRNREVQKAYSNLVSVEKWLYAMNPKSRRNNDFCRPAPSGNFEEAKNAGRYRSINAVAYDELRTLEVRVHAGTVNATKINNWIRVLLAAVNRGVGNAVTPEEFTRSLGLKGFASSYTKQRINEFNQEKAAEEAA